MLCSAVVRRGTLSQVSDTADFNQIVCNSSCRDVLLNIGMSTLRQPATTVVGSACQQFVAYDTAAYACVEADICYSFGDRQLEFRPARPTQASSPISRSANHDALFFHFIACGFQASPQHAPGPTTLHSQVPSARSRPGSSEGCPGCNKCRHRRNQKDGC